MRGMLAVICAAFLLAGCGSSPELDRNRRAVQQILNRGGSGNFDPRFTALLEARKPALLVSFLNRNVTGGVLQERREGDTEIWRTPDGAGLTTQAGMLIATRGLGAGLMAADVTAPLALVRRGQAGTVERFHTYLGGDDRAVTRSYLCIVEPLGTRRIDLGRGPIETVHMREACRNLDQSFTNLYWVSQGRIVQSRQWTGAYQGVITTRDLPEY